MTTPEQQTIIAKLHYMGRQYGNGQMARGGPSGKHYLTEAAEMLESLIAERDALKAELAAIKGAGEPVAWIVRKVDWSERMSDVIRGSNPPAWADVAHPLYTRPAVPLTDKQIFASEEIKAANAEIGLLFSSLLKLVRAIEAAHNIKGA